MGDSNGLLDGITVHSSFGSVRFRYATAALHWGSIDGREKAGPQIWSSSIVISNWAEVG